MIGSKRPEGFGRVSCLNLFNVSDNVIDNILNGGDLVKTETMERLAYSLGLHVTVYIEALKVESRTKNKERLICLRKW